MIHGWAALSHENAVRHLESSALEKLTVTNHKRYFVSEDSKCNIVYLTFDPPVDRDTVRLGVYGTHPVDKVFCDQVQVMLNQRLIEITGLWVYLIWCDLLFDMIWLVFIYFYLWLSTWLWYPFLSLHLKFSPIVLTFFSFFYFFFSKNRVSSTYSERFSPCLILNLLKTKRVATSFEHLIRHTKLHTRYILFLYHCKTNIFEFSRTDTCRCRSPEHIWR